MKLTSILSISAIASLATANVLIQECSVINNTATNEASYFFTLGTLDDNNLRTTGICAACKTTLTTAAAAANVTIDSFQCIDTIGDALFMLTYNYTGAEPIFGLPASSIAVSNGLVACDIEFVELCPFPPENPEFC